MAKEHIKKAEEVIAGFFDSLGKKVKLESAEAGDGYIHCKIDLPEAAVVIEEGGSGKFVNALQYLVNRVLDEGPGVETPRLVLDINDYRVRREERLRQKAEQIAVNVRASGVEQVLEPLDPRERRVVHMALAEQAGVGTRSVGDGLFKNILVYPVEPETSTTD